MSKAYKCDACGKMYEHIPSDRLIEFKINSNNRRVKNVIVFTCLTNSGTEIQESFDVCPDCLAKIVNIMRGGKENE